MRNQIWSEPRFFDPYSNLTKIFGKSEYISMCKIGNYLLILVICFYASLSKGNANDNSIFIAPLTSVVGGISLGYDYLLTDRQSLGVEVSNYNFTTNIFAYRIYKSERTFGLRYVFWNSGIESPGQYYVSKLIHSNSYTIQFDRENSRLTTDDESYNLLVGSGYNWSWREFFVRLGGGLSLTRVIKSDYSSNGSSPDQNFKQWPIGLFMEFNIAYNF